MVRPEAVQERYKHLHNSYIENGGPVPIVTGADMLLAYEGVVGAGQIKNVNLFPIAGGKEALKSFPRAYIIGTSKEACRDDSTVLEAALTDAGVSVRRDNLPALPHYFWIFPVQLAGSRFREALVEGMKWINAFGQLRLSPTAEKKTMQRDGLCMCHEKRT